MSEWKKVKLIDCCLKIGSGSTPKGGSTVYVESGTSFIRSQNVYNLSFDYNGLTHITEDAANKLNGVTIFNDDILLNITGDSVARTCIVPNDVLPARVNHHVAIVRADCKMINSRFLNYYLASPGMQAHMLSLAVGKGASRNAMTKQMIENFEVPCPSLSTQHRIATILSRYDSLIENYQKQIKLLEEAAQRLYKEWFVDLHFPGHENTKIVDGVPEGWEKKKVGEIGKVITGKTPSTAKKEYYGGQIPFITIPDMHTGIYPTSSQFLSSLGANSQSGKFIPANSLMVSCIGTAGLVCITKEECQTNQQINSLVLNDNSLLYYMYNTFLSLKGHLNNIGSNGATMTNVNKSKFESIEILIPTNSISNLYNKAVEQSFRSTETLSSQVRLLTEARDRLLPKLMSGEIEI